MNRLPLSGRVLVVEDEPMVREVTQDLLEHYGCIVTAVEDGLQAFTALQGEADFDLVMVDVCLPDISGLDIIRQVRKRDSSIPIILSSGLDCALNVSTLNDDAIKYLKKPFGIDELFSTVERALKKRASVRTH